MLDFLVFDIPKSMFMFINAEMIPKKGASVASARKFYSYLTLYVTFAVVLDENWNF